MLKSRIQLTELLTLPGIHLQWTVKQPKGPFKYYVSKIVGGWVRPNAYVCLHSGWVGIAKCLRNQITEKTDFFLTVQNG